MIALQCCTVDLYKEPENHFTPSVTPHNALFPHSVHIFQEFNYKGGVMNRMPSKASEVIRCKHQVLSDALEFGHRIKEI